MLPTLNHVLRQQLTLIVTGKLLMAPSSPLAKTTLLYLFLCVSLTNLNVYSPAQSTTPRRDATVKGCMAAAGKLEEEKRPQS